MKPLNPDFSEDLEYKEINTDIENLLDICICTPAGDFSDRIQELHIKVLHILIEMIERYFHPENY